MAGKRAKGVPVKDREPASELEETDIVLDRLRDEKEKCKWQERIDICLQTEMEGIGYPSGTTHPMAAKRWCEPKQKENGNV